MTDRGQDVASKHAFVLGELQRRSEGIMRSPLAALKPLCGHDFGENDAKIQILLTLTKALLRKQKSGFEKSP
jgi:hypothetical protein